MRRAQTYPIKPVRVIVSLAPAGGLDATSRIFAQKLGEHLNQQVVVENRPGAGGAVGGDLVAKAPADGYTLLTSSIGYAVIASSHKNLSYDPVRDLTPVAVMVNVTNILVIHPSLPVKSVQGAHRIRESSSGRVELFLRREWRISASYARGFQARDRHRHAARSV